FFSSRRRHTRFSRDWSSDVCSSDLLPRAKEHLESLDLVRQGWVIGGFDNEGGTGHTTVFGPEQGPIDLGTAWPGKERDVSWRERSEERRVGKERSCRRQVIQ